MAATDAQRGVKVPQELHSVPHRPLEEYVRSRLVQFGPVLASRISHNLSAQVVQQATQDALAALPPPDYSGAALESRDLQLVFRHDCQSLGCLDPQCVLCEHNPHRRCSVNFASKYLVNDTLVAKCEAPIRCEVIDRATGLPVGEDLPALTLELCVVDGNQYDQRCGETPGDERAEDAEACSLLLNNKATALLVPGPGGSHNPEGKVVVPLTRGCAMLPDVHVSDSSEALLSGRKPPFRLMARAVAPDGTRVAIRHAVSEGFVVATRRTRTAGKVDIPNVDDHVGKLEHMGRETVKKLQDIRGSALQSGVDIQVPDNCINKVGEFRKLALLAEADGHLRQKLQQVLKLSKEKWEEARDHAMRAVVADNRMRIWYADKANMELGLLFTCRLGSVELDRPVGLLTKKAQDGAQTTMEATLMAQQTPAQREQVRALQPQAAQAWWQHGHPGWAIYPVDSEQFMATGALDPAALPSHDQIVAPLGGPGAPAGAPPMPINPAFASAFMGAAQAGVPNDMLLRALGGNPFAGLAMPYMGGQLPHAAGLQLDGSGHTPFAEAAAHGQQQQQGPQQQQGQQGPPRQNGGGMAPPPPPGGANASPFGRLGLAPSLDNMPSLNLGNLQAMLGPDFKLPMLAGFPSLPGQLPGSGDLEQLLAQHGGDLAMAGRLPSFALGPEMHAEAAAAAGGPGSAGGVAPGPGGRTPSAQAPPGSTFQSVPPQQQTQALPARPGSGGGTMQRRNSGLESMQSIEHALADTQRRAAAAAANGGGGSGGGAGNSMHDAMDAALRAVQPTLSGSKRK